MWPRVLAQLFELLPHISRLLPLADRFLQAKASDQEANAQAMHAMAEGLRGDLGQVTASHAGLYRQMNELDTKATEIAADTSAMRTEVDHAGRRIARLEEELSLISKLSVALCAGMVTALILLAVVLFRHR